MILEWKEKADGFVYRVLALYTLANGRLALGAKPNPPCIATPTPGSSAATGSD